MSITDPGTTAFAQNTGGVAVVSGSPEAARQRNKNTVGVIAGDYAGTHLHVVTDLASVLNTSADLRVLPVVGQGSLQNIEDLLFLSGIDVAIVQADVLSHLQDRSGSKNLADKVNYIVKLFNEEFHLIAARNVGSLADLAGKPVSFGPVGGGTAITAAAIFKAAGVDVEPQNHDLALALEMLRKGELAAVAYVGGKPVDAITSLTAESGLHLVPVNYAESLRNTYLPAKFTFEDYPSLVDRGHRVGSVSVGSVMAVYNWPQSSKERYQRVVKFIESFLISHEALKGPPRHPKWRELTIGVTIPGWNRYPPAERMIEALAATNASKQRNGSALPVLRPEPDANQGSRDQTIETVESETLKAAHPAPALPPVKPGTNLKPAPASKSEAEAITEPDAPALPAVRPAVPNTGEKPITGDDTDGTGAAAKGPAPQPAEANDPILAPADDDKTGVAEE